MIGYLRVSSQEQGDSQLGLEAQRAAILRAYPSISRFETDVASGREMRKRHGLERAIEACELGDSPGIVVAKYDRLSRSIVDFGRLVERAQSGGWALTVLDIGVDMATPMGRLLANVLVSVAQYEAEMTGQRTRDALAVAKARGVKIGRPCTIPETVKQEARRLLDLGVSPQEIAARLPISRASVYTLR